MSHPSRRFVGATRGGVVATIAILAIAATVIIYAVRTHRTRRPHRVVSTTAPATHPATLAATKPVGPPPPTDYMSLVLYDHPDFPTTQSLAIPVADFNDAARLAFNEPIYLDNMGDLWITRPDAPPLSTVIRNAKDDEQAHLTRDRVVFAFRTLNEKGKVQQQVIVDHSGEGLGVGGQLELIGPEGRIDVGFPGRKYRWDRAAWVMRERDEGLIVPTDTGVSIIRPRSRPMELYHEFANGSSATSQPTTAPSTQPLAAEPQYLLDMRGLLAWLPWDQGATGAPGSNGAARFVEGKWTALDAEHGGWPQRILHMVPLLDGSCLVLVLQDDGSVTTQLMLLDTAEVDRAKVDALITQLADPDPKVREAAHGELGRYGPGIFPILEQVKDDQPPEAKVRIERLLRAKTKPMLGRLMLNDGPVRVVARFKDGGALLFSEAGVSAPSPDPMAEPVTTAPAWIAIRPGRPIELASPFLTADLKPVTARLTGFSDEWILVDEVNGAQRFLGNHFEPMLRKGERSYRDVVGTDRRGRWLFRREPFDGTTLIVDPTLPDSTPRLPVWQYPVEGGTVGWTIEGWPVVKRGGAWVIEKDGTRPLKPEEEFYSDPREMPDTTPTTASVPTPTTSPATAPTTAAVATTSPTTLPSEPPLLVDSSGGRFYDGTATLRYISADGRDVTWPLPPEAVGSSPTPHLVEAENRLFLFNEPGRALRLRRTSNGPDPFALESIFTRNIPNIDSPTRLWLDPAGRIVMAYDGNRLTIMFPSGRIPPAIAQRMLASDLKANESE
jgi:hypothetical protein